MAKVVAPNFSEAQEQRIRETAPHNLASATELATEFGKTPRSVVAKIVRMDVGYQSKGRVTKNGEPVVSKADLVKLIGSVVEGNLTDLDKAPKAALLAVAGFVAQRQAAAAE